MLISEATNRMLEGYLISHESFKPHEYLWMDRDYIVRDEDGNEFETQFNRKDEYWQQNWFIYKKKAKIKTDRHNKPDLNIKVETEEPTEYVNGIPIPPINSKRFDGLAEMGIEPTIDEDDLKIVYDAETKTQCIEDLSSSKPILNSTRHYIPGKSQTYNHISPAMEVTLIEDHTDIMGQSMIVKALDDYEINEEVHNSIVHKDHRKCRLSNKIKLIIAVIISILTSSSITIIIILGLLGRL